MGDHQHGLGVLSACGGGGGQLWWQVLLIQLRIEPFLAENRVILD